MCLLQIAAAKVVYCSPNNPDTVWENVSFYANLVACWPSDENPRGMAIDGWPAWKLELEVSNGGCTCMSAAWHSLIHLCCFGLLTLHLKLHLKLDR